MSNFKDIQYDLSQGKPITLKGMGISRTPYHQLMIDTKKSDQIIKCQKFIENLNREKNNVNELLSTSNREKQILSKLEHNLKSLNSSSDLEDMELFSYTKADTMKSDGLKMHLSKDNSLKLIKNLVKTNERYKQNHLKRLNYMQGQY